LDTKTLWGHFSDNFFDLMPGETAMIDFTPNETTDILASDLTIYCLNNWNLEYSPLPSASHEPGLIWQGTAVSLMPSPENAGEVKAIYYTTDGSIPDTNSAVFRTPLRVEKDMSIRYRTLSKDNKMSEAVKPVIKLCRILVT
ncbi:MAG: hypothetical protein HC896_06600, partial [Bacteroidales bacterium]|nr:hypothetical protein [Bacteroidales bacterium]